MLTGLEKEVYEKYSELGILPTKYNLKEITGSTYMQLFNNGFRLSDMQKKLRLLFSEKECQFCGVSFNKPNAKFCSHSCSAKYNNLKRGHKNSNCLNCGTGITSNAKSFCSTKCDIESRLNKKFNDWISGINLPKTNKSIRTMLTSKCRGCCSKCNIDSWNGSAIVLEVEHIDGNSENNSFDNVTLLCPNCHSQTDTYNGKNKGNGRFKRRQRYKDGKSY